MANDLIYRFYAELRNYKPKTGRRFEVSAEITTAQLDRILSVIFDLPHKSRYCFDIHVEENFKVCVGEYIDNEVNQKALTMFRENPERAFCRIELRTDNDYTPAGWSEDAETTVLKNVLTCENERMTYVCDGRPIDVKLEKITQNKLPEKGVPRVTGGNGIDVAQINERLKHC